MSSLALCLDNLRSVYNVGSIFRTADGLGIHPLHLCGITPTPLHPKLQKTALGSSAVVPWTHHCRTIDFIRLQKSHTAIVCLETQVNATPLPEFNFPPSACLVVGNEVTGIPDPILELADEVVVIPQVGLKNSFNVTQAATIAMYEWYRQSQCGMNNP